MKKKINHNWFTQAAKLMTRVKVILTKIKWLKISCLTSLIKYKKNQNLILKIMIPARMVIIKILRKDIKITSMNNLNISEPLDTMRCQVNYWADAFALRSEINLA